MIAVTKDALVGPTLVGPIAAGETPEEAALRVAQTFGKELTSYAFLLYKEPICGPNQQFEEIIGTVWAVGETKGAEVK